MLDGYIPLLIVLVLVMLGLIGIYLVLPTIGANRFKKTQKISLKPDVIIENAAFELGPPVKEGHYLEPYESGEVAKGDFRAHINVQYYVVILLFIVFDVDMVLLFPWAFDFMKLGIIPFLETIAFLLMPLFIVAYAFKEGYMRWLK